MARLKVKPLKCFMNFGTACRMEICMFSMCLTSNRSTIFFLGYKNQTLSRCPDITKEFVKIRLLMSIDLLAANFIPDTDEKFTLKYHDCIHSTTKHICKSAYCLTNAIQWRNRAGITFKAFMWKLIYFQEIKCIKKPF